MSLLYFEGFDDTNANNGDLFNKYPNGGISLGDPTRSYYYGNYSTGRFGSGQYLSFSGGYGPQSNPLYISGNIINGQFKQYQDMILGFSMYAQAGSPYPNVSWVRVQNNVSGADYVVNFSGDNAGNMGVYDGVGNLLSSIPNIPYRDSAWHYYEFRIKIDKQKGVIQLRVDGNLVCDLQNINTAANSDYITKWVIQGYGYNGSVGLSISGSNFALDDLYLTDNSDGAGFLGEVRVTYVPPVSDTATKSFTPNAGTNNYSRVADIFQDNDTSYVQSTTAGDIDVYQLGGISIPGSTVIAVQPTASVKTSAYPASYDLSIGFGGSTYYQTSGLGFNPGINYYQPQLGNLYTKNPYTNAPWANSDIGNSFIGIKRIS